MRKSTTANAAPVIDVVDNNLQDAITAAVAKSSLGGEWTVEQLMSRQDTLAQDVTDVLLAAGYTTAAVYAAEAALMATFAVAGGALSATAVVISVGAVVATALYAAIRYDADLRAVSTWVCHNVTAAYNWVKEKLTQFWNWICSFFSSEEAKA